MTCHLLNKCMNLLSHYFVLPFKIPLYAVSPVTNQVYFNST